MGYLQGYAMASMGLIFPPSGISQLKLYNVPKYFYCRAIKSRKTNGNNSSEHENEDRKNAIVLFGIVVIFLVSNIPRILLNAYEFFVLSSECIIVPFWVFVMTSINGLCLTFNSSFNFFVYCFVNPR